MTTDLDPLLKGTLFYRSHDRTTALYLFVVAVAGVVLRFASAHPVVRVAQASPGAVQRLLGAGDGFLDGNARRYPRRGVGQLRHTGNQERQVPEVLEELDGPRVPGGRARLSGV